jgi:hypothetical protein
MPSMPRHGFIRDKLEIKYLVLFILKQLSEPVPFALLAEMSLCDGAIDYFEFSDAAMELVTSGHIREEPDSLGSPLYFITEKGRETAEVCESSLPYSVRTAAQRSILLVTSRMHRDASISTEIENVDDHPVLTCSLRDDKGVILSLSLSTVTQRQATMLENNFKRHAERIVNAILSAMLSDYDEPEE